jgi:hypothetical protein
MTSFYKNYMLAKLGNGKAEGQRKSVKVHAQKRAMIRAQQIQALFDAEAQFFEMDGPNIEMDEGAVVSGAGGEAIRDDRAGADEMSAGINALLPKKRKPHEKKIQTPESAARKRELARLRNAKLREKQKDLNPVSYREKVRLQKARQRASGAIKLLSGGRWTLSR